MRILAFILLLSAARLSAQSIDKTITPDAVLNIENVLASDAMRGRATFTPDIERAADYLEAQFKQAGLQTWNGSASYRQPFSMIKAKLLSLNGTLAGDSLTRDNTVVISSAEHLEMNGDHVQMDGNSSNYKFGWIHAGDDLRSTAQKLIAAKANHLVFVDTSFAKTFTRLSRMAGQQFGSPYTNVFILKNDTPGSHFSFTLKAEQEIKESKLANLVGILPGKSKKNEYVIFSGHYDHLGVGRPINGDSIYNGANDDASGTTAVVLLARYFSQLKNNDRTLIFAAFTAEEIGEYGSQYFSRQFDPAEVIAMFNIEMIGSPSKWGDNSAFITGYERTDMAKILEKNLVGSKFTFYPDPYTSQGLFYRSDNASLARQGVPAHTISTTQIDIDSTYHKPSDEVRTLDIKNMAEIIKAIAISSTTIVEGKDTPTRVDTTQIH